MTKRAIDRLEPILVVEDSPEDYESVVRAFSRVGLTNPVFRCEDGEDALDYLFRRGVYADPLRSPRPAVILLDLNLPGTDGREVLTEIKADHRLRRIPVIVLTTSAAEDDVQTCYAAGANSYLQKPVRFDGLVDTVRWLKGFWFDVALLPVSEVER